MPTLARSIPLLLILAASVGCSSAGTESTSGGGGSGSSGSTKPTTGSGENLGDGHQAIDKFIDELNDLVLPDTQSKTLTDCTGDMCPKDAQEGDSFCSYKHYAETVHYDKFVAFAPNSATLWPGVVVRGADAQEGLLTPIGVKLAPMTFSVSLENIANSPVGHLEEPSLSTFRDARNAILAGGVTGATAASLDFDVQEIHSQSQIATALGAGVNWPGGGAITASFDFNSSDKKTKILVNLTQAYYTIDVDSPTTPKDFFDASVTVDDLKPYADDKSPPLYVQSITFGRRVLFSVESDETAESIKAALEATYKGAVDVTAKVTAEQQKALQSSTIRAFVIGGAGGEATGAINGFEGLVTYVKNGGNYSKDSPGAPIAYKLAYLDNTATQLAFTTEYSERECTKNQGAMHVDLVSFNHLSGTDVGGNIEFYGYVTARVPTLNNGVLSCTKGGKEVDLWRYNEGTWLTMPELTTWKPTNPIFLDLNNVKFGKGQAICLAGHLWDEDYSTGELTSDDDFGGDEQLIQYENGWEGEHVLQLRGPGNAAVDVTIAITLK